MTDTKFFIEEDGTLHIDQSYETGFGWQRQMVDLSVEDVERLKELLSSPNTTTVSGEP